MSACKATDGTNHCTLHEGHAGSHYDSLRDESFEAAERCPCCGQSGPQTCSHTIPADGISDEHCPVCGRCCREECRPFSGPMTVNQAIRLLDAWFPGRVTTMVIEQVAGGFEARVDVGRGRLRVVRAGKAEAIEAALVKVRPVALEAA